MLKLQPRKGIGTPVRCPSCRYPNLAIDIWCERCGTPLDWQHSQVLASEAAPNPPEEPEAATILRPKRRRAHLIEGWTLPRLTLPALAMPRIQVSQWRLPTWKIDGTVPRLKVPVIPRTVGIVAIVVALLLLVPLAYVLLPTSRSVARRPVAAHLPVTNANKGPSDSPVPVAIAAVQTKTGLRYSAKCSGTGPCLSVTGQTTGRGAAAIVFSTAAKGGRECVAYVVQTAGKWHSLDTACGLPGQVTPLVGHDATVHVPGNCANVHQGPSMQAGVATCLHDGTTIKVDGGPVYADGLMWWHLGKGWMAHDFLVAP